MQDACQERLISKKGNVSDLRETLTRHRLAKMSAKDFKKYVVPKKAKPHKETASSASAKAPPPEEAKDGDSHVPSHAPEEGHVVEHGGGQEASEAHSSSDMVLFGRSTFSMEFDPKEDKSGLFYNMDDDVNGPAVEKPQGYLALVEAGENGVIPVAAMVKIFQGFSDVQEGGNHVAMLLAGRVGVRSPGLSVYISFFVFFDVLGIDALLLTGPGYNSVHEFSSTLFQSDVRHPKFQEGSSPAKCSQASPYGASCHVYCPKNR